MSKALPYTQASLRRRIAAAQSAGLRVTGITPDGTVLTVQDGDNTPDSVSKASPPLHSANPPSKWEDASR